MQRLEDRGELNLYIIRHGETYGNKCRPLYRKLADHAIRLTRKGKKQAHKAGAFLAEHLRGEHDADPEGFGAVRVWYSPYYRTRQTAHGILYELGQVFDTSSGIISYRQEDFLIEQKAGLFDGMMEEEFKEKYPDEAENYERHKKYFGRMYGATPLGESVLDVVIRVKQHFRTVIEDYKGRNIRHVVIVTHGVTARAFEKGWMRYEPEWMDAERNPRNCWIRHLHGRPLGGYVDEGYVHGDLAPLRDVMATQRKMKNARWVYMLKPQRPNAIVPPGIKVIDPFAKPLI